MDDYISREECIKDLREYEETALDGLTVIGCMSRIKRIPAADVRPVVQGAWERPRGSTPRSWIFVCSKCGDRAYFPVPKYFPKGCGYSFCPNCGADMREVKVDG